MPISVTQSILIMLACALCTFAERLLPFVVFRGGKTPKIVEYLGKLLPTAVMATLVVYFYLEKTFERRFEFQCFGAKGGAKKTLEKDTFSENK